jgi:hypothetical protein
MGLVGICYRIAMVLLFKDLSRRETSATKTTPHDDDMSFFFDKQYNEIVSIYFSLLSYACLFTYEQRLSLFLALFPKHNALLAVFVFCRRSILSVIRQSFPSSGVRKNSEENYGPKYMARASGSSRASRSYSLNDTQHCK